MLPEESWTKSVVQLERAVAARGPVRPIDAVYLFRHSANGDQEIRYSLRSVAAHLPFIRKVWIFGDRPEFLSADKRLVEHVPHEYLAPLFGYRTPVRSDFLMQFLASLIPDLASDFVRFADDYIVLAPLSPEQLMTPRALEDLNRAPARGRGKYKQLVWKTYDVLQHYGFAGYNFEAHVPQPLTKRLVLEAFLAFREFLSEDRLQSLVTLTSLYNYALKYHGLKFRWLAQDRCRAGFYGAPRRAAGNGTPQEAPAAGWTADEVRGACQGRLFLNFDDQAWGPGIEEFLRERFPEPSRFERAFDSRSPASDLRLPTSNHRLPAPGRPAARPTELLAAAFARAVASGGQMSPGQYFRVVMELLERGPCNLLVFGAGRDTELYVRANAGGRTAVLERHAAWIDQVRHLDCQIVPVTYTTRLGDGPLEHCPLPGGLPAWLLEEKWDVILIDAPEGNRGDTPGRQQSIFLASQLARPGATIFLHDYDRPAEQALAGRYLKPLDERHGSLQTLAVFRYGQPAPTALGVVPPCRGRTAVV